MKIFLTVCMWIQVSLAPMTALAEAPSYVDGEIIVKYKNQTGLTAKQAHQKMLRRMSDKLELKHAYDKVGLYHYALHNQEVLDAVSDLKNDSSVEYAEPNYILKKMTLTSDPTVFSQNHALVQVAQAWAQMSPNSAKVPIVAIVDTGVDYTHPVFTGSNAMWTNVHEVVNGIDDDANGYIDDVRGWNFFSNTNDPMDDDEHGTHVAGIILGVGENIFASPMAQAKIKIMPVKFLGADGSGSTTAAISAIYYAVNNGANIINNSWGGSGYSQALHDALTYAYNNNVFIATAAGNSATNDDSSPTYPASLPVPSQLTVAATDDLDNLASFSNIGFVSVASASPGVNIISTVPGSGYAYLSGTSMATPFVAGIAALVMREAPSLTGYQIKNVIVNSGNNLSNLNGLIAGQNRVNVYNAVVAAQAQTSTAPYEPVYVASVPRGVASTSGSSSAGGCGLVKSTLANPKAAEKTGGQIAFLLGITLLPLLIWQTLRRTAPENRRKYERFAMNSEIKFRVGDKDLVGQMKTISMGGVSFNAEELLEKGGIVTLQIASPDGKEQLQVQGHIVWSEENKSYGVQFEQAQSAIAGWTQDLTKNKAS